jgi:A/G-specific adenine glycosylase
LLFTEKLINWYTESKRDLPWRKSINPYNVWLSEIILQQTRVEQGLPYYLKFTEAFLTIDELASASENEVLRLWQGLGYYSRARNLHSAAKYISKDLNGKFPETYSELIKLPGIGPYTAAAISSICFNEAMPVVDGNVFRFASRYFGIKEDIGKTSTRKLFEKKLSRHISKKFPGAFNQAMMEFGSSICSPQPSCETCPFSHDCYAHINGMQKELPKKAKKIKTRQRVFNYLVIYDGANFYMRQRGKEDVWAHLYDFNMIEGSYEKEVLFKKIAELVNGNFVIEEVSERFKHILSHQKIEAFFYKIKLTSLERKKAKSSLGQLYSIEEIVNLPKPKLIVNYLEKIGIKS